MQKFAETLFHKGRALKRESLEVLRDFPGGLAKLGLSDWADGILYGFDISYEGVSACQGCDVVNVKLWREQMYEQQEGGHVSCQIQLVQAILQGHGMNHGSMLCGKWSKSELHDGNRGCTASDDSGPACKAAWERQGEHWGLYSDGECRAVWSM